MMPCHSVDDRESTLDEGQHGCPVVIYIVMVRIRSQLSLLLLLLL